MLKIFFQQEYSAAIVKEHYLEHLLKSDNANFNVWPLKFLSEHLFFSFSKHSFISSIAKNRSAH